MQKQLWQLQKPWKSRMAEHGKARACMSVTLWWLASCSCQKGTSGASPRAPPSGALGMEGQSLPISGKTGVPVKTEVLDANRSDVPGTLHWPSIVEQTSSSSSHNIDLSRRCPFNILSK